MEQTIKKLRQELSEKKEELKKIEIDYKNVYNKSPDMFVSVDPVTAIIKNCNDTLSNKTGYKKNEIIGQTIFFIYHEDCLSNVKKAFESFVSKGIVRNVELELKKKNGDKITVLLNVNAVKDKAGKIIYSNSSWTDITEIKQLRQDLEQANSELALANKELENRVQIRTKQLEQKNKELSQFVYIASHDLQEPLRTINSFTGLLIEEFEKDINEDSKLYLNFISEASNRMSTLVKGLLDYGLIGQNKTKSNLCCNGIVQTIQDDFYLKIKETEASIVVQDLPELSGFEMELRLLFQNLISNAIKFRQDEKKPKIEVSAKKLGDKWEFLIKDNGIGIAPENTERIFGIFQRLHTRDIYEGTGIGLSHCKKIVELHGGDIWVDSKVNEGSSFYFTIPQN